MNNLLLTAGIITFVLYGSYAQAGSPMMDDPLPISVRGDTGTDSFKAETGNQYAKPHYKSYRDRLGHGNDQRVEENIAEKKQLRDLGPD